MGICYSSAAKSSSNGESEQKSRLQSSSSGSWMMRRRMSKRWSGTHEGGKNEDEFGQGRLVINGASKVACLYTQQGKKGTNQDAMLLWESFSSQSDTIFCGVFDGHGPYGHVVARKVRDSLPLILRTEWKASLTDGQRGLDENGDSPGKKNPEETASQGMDDEWYESLEIEENGKYPEMYLPLRQSMLKAFKQMDMKLKLDPATDCFCSGTTAVTFIKKGEDLVIANVGDSRAVLATRDKDGSLLAVQLTVDLKPDLPREAARIQQCKGRVFALQDEPEVARVWLPDSDSPGLAMARAFGDFCLKDYGLISVPDIFYRRLTDKDEFIILATDGVWDVLSNKEAVDIATSAPSRGTAARALVDCATRAWRLKYPTSKTDDCAVVCLFLEHVSAPNGVSENDTVRNLGEAGGMAATEATNGVPRINDDSNTCKVGGSDEIVPVPESETEKYATKSRVQSKRSLAECISTAEDEEWSALEGITRVNSLLSLPRFLSTEKRVPSWRKRI